MSKINKDEIFYPVIGLEKYYEINRLGVVRSIDRTYIKVNGVKFNHKGAVLTQRTAFGYKTVNMTVSEIGYHKIMRVHRLLAMQFIPNPNNYPVINHKNGIRDDNRLCNIEWVSVQYNNWHTYSQGRLMHNRVLSYDDVHFIYHNTMVPRKPYNRPGKYTMNEMCEKYNVTKRTIIKILKKLSYLEMVNTFEDISWYGEKQLKQA